MGRAERATDEGHCEGENRTTRRRGARTEEDQESRINLRHQRLPGARLVKFPYTIFPSPDGNVFFATLDVMLFNRKTGKASYRYKVVLDSGASHCVFHAGIGETIGIDVTSGRKMPLKGVTHAVGKQYLHDVTVIVDGVSYLVEAGFSYDLNFPFGLLGQKGFFDQNRICFDRPVGDFEITPKSRKGIH